MNRRHPLMQYLTGVMDVPSHSVKMSGSLPELDENIPKASFWGRLGFYNFHAYAPDMDTLHASFYFRGTPGLGMTLKNGEEAELRISNIDDFSDEQLETVYLLLTKMEKHHGFRRISFDVAKLFLEETE